MGLIKWIILIVVVGIIVWRIGFEILWRKGWKEGLKERGDNEPSGNTRFVIVEEGERKGNETTSVSGLVINFSVVVGDKFCLVDDKDVLIVKDVVVVSINTGTFKNKFIDEAQPNNAVTLCLKMPDIKLKAGYTLVIDEQEKEDTYSQFMDERYEEDAIDDDDDYQSIYDD